MNFCQCQFFFAEIIKYCTVTDISTIQRCRQRCDPQKCNAIHLFLHIIPGRSLGEKKFREEVYQYEQKDQYKNNPHEALEESHNLSAVLLVLIGFSERMWTIHVNSSASVKKKKLKENTFRLALQRLQLHSFSDQSQPEQAQQVAAPIINPFHATGYAKYVN